MSVASSLSTVAPPPRAPATIVKFPRQYEFNRPNPDRLPFVTGLSDDFLQRCYGRNYAGEVV